jgi:pilus assembly protein CpaD
MINQPIKSIILGITLAGLSACAPTSGTYSGAEVQMRNLVQHVRLSETVDLSTADNADLSAEAKLQINRFLKINMVGYGDRLSLDVGDDQTGVYNAVRAHLLSFGYILENQAPISGAAPNLGQGILIVDRFIVTPPNCHSTSKVGGNIPLTISSPSFGCSHQVNLGLMVANPQDLIDPQNTRLTSGEVSSAAVKAYRLGLPPKKLLDISTK